MLQLPGEQPREGQLHLLGEVLQLLVRGPPCRCLPAAGPARGLEAWPLPIAVYGESTGLPVAPGRWPRAGSDASDDTTSARSASTRRSPSVPRCCAPSPPPPPPPPWESPATADGGAAGIIAERAARQHVAGFVVVPRSANLQAAEDALGLVLVVVVGGTRPHVSTPMVARFLFDHFGIEAEDADVRRHDPEDFIVHFRHRADRDRVLVTPPGEPSCL